MPFPGRRCSFPLHPAAPAEHAHAQALQQNMQHFGGPSGRMHAPNTPPHPSTLRLATLLSSAHMIGPIIMAPWHTRSSRVLSHLHNPLTDLHNPLACTPLSPTSGIRLHNRRTVQQRNLPPHRHHHNISSILAPPASSAPSTLQARTKHVVPVVNAVLLGSDPIRSDQIRITGLKLTGTSTPGPLIKLGSSPTVTNSSSDVFCIAHESRQAMAMQHI